MWSKQVLRRFGTVEGIGKRIDTLGDHFLLPIYVQIHMWNKVVENNIFLHFCRCPKTGQYIPSMRIRNFELTWGGLNHHIETVGPSSQEEEKRKIRAQSAPVSDCTYKMKQRNNMNKWHQNLLKHNKTEAKLGISSRKFLCPNIKIHVVAILWLS